MSQLLESLSSFLQEKELSMIEHRQDDSFGDEFWRYAGKRLEARVLLDRGIGFLEVGASFDQQVEWFDIPILKGLVDPSLDDDAMSLEDQFEFVRAHWQELEDRFSQENRRRTRSELQTLLEARARRRLKFT